MGFLVRELRRSNGRFQKLGSVNRDAEKPRAVNLLSKNAAGIHSSRALLPESAFGVNLAACFERPSSPVVSICCKQSDRLLLKPETEGLPALVICRAVQACQAYGCITR